MTTNYLTINMRGITMTATVTHAKTSTTSTPITIADTIASRGTTIPPINVYGIYLFSLSTMFAAPGDMILTISNLIAVIAATLPTSTATSLGFGVQGCPVIEFAHGLHVVMARWS